MANNERDYPLGHPSSSDFNPKSAEAIEWRRMNVHPAGERDFPVGHFGAADNPNRVEPTHPQFTTRDFSRPETIPVAEYEAVTGLVHPSTAAARGQVDADEAARRQADEDLQRR